MSKPQSDFDSITRGFIQYLEKTGQLSKLPHLAKEQLNLSRNLFDPNLAIVQTVIKLESKEKAAIRQKLESILDRPIKVKNEINKKILGGMLIRIGDQIIDTSLRSRLKALKQKLSHAL